MARLKKLRLTWAIGHSADPRGFLSGQRWALGTSGLIEYYGKAFNLINRPAATAQILIFF